MMQMGKAKVTNGDVDSYWFEQDDKSKIKVSLKDIHFCGPPMQTHIAVGVDSVDIQKVTMIAGDPNNWWYIRHGVYGLLKLGVIRRTRLRKIFGIKQIGKR